MGISANFNINDIDATFKALLAEVDRQLIESLTRVGEEAVKLAKMIPPERGFKDRTGNLRSSIGYVVLVDGKPVNVAFAAVKGGSVKFPRRPGCLPTAVSVLYCFPVAIADVKEVRVLVVYNVLNCYHIRLRFLTFGALAGVIPNSPRSLTGRTGGRSS